MTTDPQKAQLVNDLEQLYQRHFDMGYVAFSGKTIGLRSRFMRLFVEAQMRSGTTKADAWEAAKECNRLAHQNADAAHMLKRLGVAA